MILTIIGSIIALFSLLFGAYKLGYKHGRKSLELKESIKLQKLRLNKIYAPLRRQLIDCDMTQVSLIKYACFLTRWERALPHLKHFKPKKFLEVLFDRGISTIKGLDYGIFDLKLVEKIVKNNMRICDNRLVNLAQIALREERDRALIPKKEGELYKEELELIDYIHEQYAKLSKIFDIKE